LTEIRHLIFDWDGTLMDSAPRIVSAMQETARRLNLSVPTDSEVNHIIGLSLEKAFDRLFGQLSEDLVSALYKEYRFQYVEGNHIATPLFDGAESMLKQVKQSGYSLAIATGKARAGLERVLAETPISCLFNDSICADEAMSKPEPDMLLQLLKRNEWDKQHCLMIGDTTHDILMAQAARIKTVAVSYGAHSHKDLSALQPDWLIDDIGQLKEVLNLK